MSVLWLKASILIISADDLYGCPDSTLMYVKSISKRVILIDGYQLANYMIDYGLGVSIAATYYLKRIDNDYIEVG